MTLTALVTAFAIAALIGISLYGCAMLICIAIDTEEQQELEQLQTNERTDTNE